MKAAREAWFAAQPGLDPDKLVFLDEATATNMARRYGRAPRGERRRLLVPQGHYKTTIVIAALCTTGPCAFDLADGATYSQRFVPTAVSFLYLAVVLDAYSRRVVGWAMASHLRLELVLGALEMAVTQRKLRDVIQYFDQGSQARSTSTRIIPTY